MSWSFSPDHVEVVTRWVSEGVAVFGLVALLLVSFGWRWIRNHYHDLHAKVAVAGFRVVAAASALLSRSSPAVEGSWFEQPWVATYVFAIVGYLFWEIAGYVGDYRFKLAKEMTLAEHEREVTDLTQSRDEAALEATGLEWLLAHLREPVSHELHRVRSVVAQSPGRVSIQQVREGLDSEGQIRTVLESLAGLFRLDVMSTGGTIRQNFRVGLYVEEAGRLEPREAFDLATKSHTPFASPRTQPELFRLEPVAGPSHAVRCVLEGRTLIVSDCATESGFGYFGEAQRTYLRSMVAYPLIDCRPDGIHVARAALLIDTNVAGYFREEDRELIESRISEFALRIELGYAIRALIT